MNMKSKRHNAILELIQNNAINTQEELMKRLKKMGFDVTQATVSRDIKALRLVKVIDKASGEYKYAYNTGKEQKDTLRLMSIFTTSIMTVEAVNNIVVMKCYTGLAEGICAAMDDMPFKNIVGTIAGDNTIFVLTRSDDAAAKLVTQVKELISE